MYQLISPRQFEVTYNNESIDTDQLIVRPLYLSICAADQRYYTGSRNQMVLKKKLPMALIHEAVGEIAYDAKNEYKCGTKVLMVPNTPTEKHYLLDENYLPSSLFRSSGFDGFMQDYVFLNRDRVVEVPEDIDLSVASYSELVSVAVHAIKRLQKYSINKYDSFGVWGDGNLGYITALLLRSLYHKAKIFVFGKTAFKLSHFSFVDEVFHIDKIPSDIKFDHAFECVGGMGSQDAINQIIEYINVQGTISILGVSENNVELNTRLVLEKGLNVVGSSRSSAEDFKDVAKLYREYPKIIDMLSMLKGEEFNVRSINDIVNAFEYDLANAWGKTVMKWTI